MTHSTIILDIGGTNMRIGLVQDGQIQHYQLMPKTEDKTLEPILRRYIEDTKSTPCSLVVGAAGELLPKGKIHLTNRDFTIDLPALCRKFNFESGLLANDTVFHALGLINKPDTKRACVIFTGTGLGCAYIQDGLIQPTENGHELIPHPTADEKKLSAKTWEEVVSGPAFLRIYKMLDGGKTPVMQSREVSYLARMGQDKNAVKTYQIIAKTLARFCLWVAEKTKISVFYIGGNAFEVLSSRSAQDCFFEVLGKKADSLSVRMMWSTEQSAMNGLKIAAEELAKTGEMKYLTPQNAYVYHQAKK